MISIAPHGHLTKPLYHDFFHVLKIVLFCLFIVQMVDSRLTLIYLIETPFFGLLILFLRLKEYLRGTTTKVLNLNSNKKREN